MNTSSHHDPLKSPTIASQEQLRDIEKAKTDAIMEIKEVSNRFHVAMTLLDEKLATIPTIKEELADIRDSIATIATTQTAAASAGERIREQP